MEFHFIASMEKKKSEDKSIRHLFSFLIIPLSSRKAVIEALANFAQYYVIELFQSHNVSHYVTIVILQIICIEASNDVVLFQVIDIPVDHLASRFPKST